MVSNIGKYNIKQTPLIIATFTNQGKSTITITNIHYCWFTQYKKTHRFHKKKQIAQLKNNNNKNIYTSLSHWFLAKFFSIPEASMFHNFTFSSIVAWVTKASINLLLTLGSMKSRGAVTDKVLELQCSTLASITAWLNEAGITFLSNKRIRVSC